MNLLAFGFPSIHPLNGHSWTKVDAIFWGVAIVLMVTTAAIYDHREALRETQKSRQ